MPIIVKSPRQIEFMREAGKLTAGARTIARQAIADGITTAEIDREVYNFITKNGATPSFLHYGGFPGSACISVNEELIHGIPGKRVVRNGDIVSVDVGAKIHGYHGDCAGTYPCGEVSEEAKRLMEVTRQSFFEGLKYAKAGNRVCDIGAAIQEYVERQGYSIVREYTGHGIGEDVHEDPSVPNYGIRGRGPRLVKGMTIAIEPMVNMGSAAIRVLDDDWTVVPMDGQLCAHYENTILITDGEPEILTMADDI